MNRLAQAQLRAVAKRGHMHLPEPILEVLAAAGLVVAVLVARRWVEGTSRATPRDKR